MTWTLDTLLGLVLYTFIVWSVARKIERRELRRQLFAEWKARARRGQA